MLIQPDHSLDQAFTEVHDQFKRAGVDTRHKFRFFSVATVKRSDSLTPQSRMVVLRSFSNDWSFEFYTDHRSSKVEELKESPIISALFWDPSKRVQVRIEAKATIHNQDDLANNRWQDVQGDAQKAYTTTIAPGSKIDTPEDAHDWPENFRSDNYTVVVCMARQIKVLQIAGMEHLAFECSRDSKVDEWNKFWIAP